MKTKLVFTNGKYYFYPDPCWYMVPDENREFRVYNDGEYKGKYCGSISALSLSEDPLGEVLKGL